MQINKKTGDRTKEQKEIKKVNKQTKKTMNE